MAGNDSPVAAAMTLRSCRPARVQCNKIAGVGFGLKRINHSADEKYVKVLVVYTLIAGLPCDGTGTDFAQLDYIAVQKIGQGERCPEQLSFGLRMTCSENR
jgi:hypothetical protein